MPAHEELLVTLGAAVYRDSRSWHDTHLHGGGHELPREQDRVGSNLARCPADDFTEDWSTAHRPLPEDLPWGTHFVSTEEVPDTRTLPTGAVNL